MVWKKQYIFAGNYKRKNRPNLHDETRCSKTITRHCVTVIGTARNLSCGHVWLSFLSSLFFISFCLLLQTFLSHLFLQIQLGSLGERCKPRHVVSDRVPAGNAFFTHLGLSKHITWQHFIVVCVQRKRLLSVFQKWVIRKAKDKTVSILSGALSLPILDSWGYCPQCFTSLRLRLWLRFVITRLTVQKEPLETDVYFYVWCMSLINI